MNSLSLRVSSVKTGENVKKNAEMRASLLTLPKHYELSDEPYCTALRNASNITEQATAVKNVFKLLDSEPKALQFLTDLFFYTPVKHPMRCQILKLLITAARQNTAEINESHIIAALSNTLQRLVEETKTATESSHWNITITSLSGCFENFECGVKALEQSLPVVFPFLCNSVQKYLTELGVLSSPSVRNEYYLNVHNSIRFILSCVQEFSQHMKRQFIDQLKQLNVVCKEIILDDEIPMDPRINAGILMAYIAKIFDNYENFIQEVKTIKHPNEIALCVGVINTFDYDDFGRLSADIRDVCSKIDEVANTHATVPNILLSAARSLFQLSKILLQFDLFAATHTLDDAKLILRKLLIFTFCYLEHHMDSVRHICKDLLRNIVALAKKISFDFLLQKIFDACNSDRLSLSMKCVVLLQAAGVLGAQEILSNCAGIFTSLFEDNLGRDFIVNNLFEGLMSASHKELPYDAWQSLWISYILHIAAANDSRLPDIEILIVKAVKCEPRIVQFIIEDLSENIPLSTKLSALWAVRKSGIKFNNFSEIMEYFSQNLQLAILSNCDETRIMALRLLVETHKSTELLTKLECEHLLTYLEYNSNCQSPATRQKSLGLLSKALIRCELNLLRTLKEYKSLPNTAKTEPPLHLKFLKEFLRILVGNLFRGANFSRRSVSLQLLEQALRVALNCELNLEDLLPPQTLTVLLGTLADSYEANKELAVGVLKLIEQKGNPCMREGEKSYLSLAEIQELLLSVRPLDSVTAAYHLEFYCSANSASAFGNYEETSYCLVYYSALRWLLQILNEGLTTAKESIMLAAKFNPLYGVLFAIKHLLKRLDFQVFSQDMAWRILMAELVVLCKELTTIVGPVVNNDSPEGHLPNDFSALPAELTVSCDNSTASHIQANNEIENCKILSQNSAKIDLNTLKTTPQMVLLCAWRTVKEVSLILGEIVLRSPIQFSKHSEHFLLSKEQILEIGEHFKQLLAETKHRGAFEQAYVGFSKLCTRLWRVETLDLNCLPMQWLRELLSLISRDEHINDKICATRRSAGVPFMVQALITSELQVGTTKSLHYCMSQLFQLCGNENQAERSAESRTHALNILRALFRCTDLSDAVAEFVSKGVVCAIRSYEATTWSERNSATLLFAALITRIFGVQRSRDSENLNIRNRMTGRIFFLRYPKLYDFFLEELKRASALISKREKAHKLHPLLLMLSRLYPSALEGTESNLKLSEFIPFISNCSACPEMQTRYLAAKANVALIAKDAVKIAVLRICADILASADIPNNINLNLLHGQLLQILLLIKTHKTQDSELIGDISSTLVTFHEQTMIKNAVILKVMLDIYIEILSCIKNFTLPQETIQNLLYFSTQKHFYAVELSYYYPVFRKSFFLYNLHMLRLTLPFGALVDFLLSPPVTQQCIYLEQAETCLNIMLLVLLHLRTSYEELTEFELTAGELDFISSLSKPTLEELCDELRQSKTLHSTLKEVVQQPIFYPECAMKAYAILSLLDNFDFTLSSLIKESKKHPGDVKSPLTMCVERLVLRNGVEFKISQLCLEYLIEISQPWQPDCLRLKASKIMSHIAVHYRKALEKKNMAFIKAFIGLMLSQVMDDDYDIRDNAAKTILNILPEDIGLKNVVSTMAQRLFLQATADILVSIKADDSYVLDVFKIITETQALASILDEGLCNNSACSQNSNSTASTTSTADLEIFDKSETNAFGEPLKAIADSIVIFKSTFDKRTKVLQVVSNYSSC